MSIQQSGINSTLPQVAGPGQIAISQRGQCAISCVPTGTETHTFGTFSAVTGFSGSNRQCAQLTATAGTLLTFTLSVAADGDRIVQPVSVSGPGHTAPVELVQVEADTDTATTVPLLVAAFEAAFPDATVAGTAGTGVITVAFPAGVYASEHQAVTEGSTTLTSDATAAGAVQRLAFVLDSGAPSAGSLDGPPTGISEGVFSALVGGGAIVSAVLPAGETPAFGGTVYVETADGADKGKAYATPSASRLAIDPADAFWAGPASDVPGVAFIQINHL